MTPQQIKQLAQPLADIYEELTTELMERIATQLAKNSDITATAQWQITKLAQCGELQRDAVQLIAKRTAVCPEMTAIVLESAALEAIGTIEPALRDAALQGLAGQAAAVSASSSLTQVLQAYQAQAKDAYNLVNTVMAYKVKDAYTGIVNKTANVESRIEYLSILGKNTASVVTGQQSRTTALRQCIKEFSEKGIPGFVDKAGREWSPEAYINMDIRTTVNNVAHQAQFARMDDYDADLVMVSSHIGARPGCEPFQGKLYSRSGKAGFAQDLNGSRIPYSSWGATSYGQPGGLLGINCGHQIYPFIPGFTRMSYKPYPKAQNDKAYAQSQRQRYLERQVRSAKRECAMLDKLGDKDGFAAASAKLKQRNQALKGFTAQTGRAFKSDRVQTADFNKRLNSKALSVIKAASKPLTNAAGTPIIKASKTFISAIPNSITQVTNRQGGVDRNYYDANGRQIKQISNNDHGKPKRHPYGLHGEHAHEYQWGDDGNLTDRPMRELTEDERKENSDIL